MRQFDKEGPRAEGPVVVWAGRDEGPAIVVVDPAGAARHNDLPATWHPLAEHFQIAWCRMPASKEAHEDVEDVLETLSERKSLAHIVASGQACASAIALASQFSDIVHAVLLVDPTDADEISKLAEGGVEMRVIAESHEGDDDRVEAPLPLGHPAVVDGLIKALATLM